MSPTFQTPSYFLIFPLLLIKQVIHEIHETNQGFIYDRKYGKVPSGLESFLM